MHNSFGTTAGMLNGEDPDSQNPTLGTEFYTNGESFGNGSTIQPMNNVSGNIWNNTNIRPDDIYPEIFFVPTDISYTNAPEEITIDRSHYHLLKFTNPYTMVDNSNFFIEFNTIPVSSNSAIDLQVYIVGKNRGISFFERSDWRNSPDVEMVGTISKDDNYHHIHSENSKHHLIRLSTNTDRTIGNKHIDISENFWIVLMASTPSAIRSWKLRYHDKSKNNGRDNDGLTNQSLSETDATWFTGNEKNRTTSPLSGLPDAHIHIARSGYDSENTEIRDKVKTEYLVSYTYNEISGTKTLVNNYQFQSIPNLPPNSGMIINPSPCEYSQTIDISWETVSDPNNDNLTYSIYIIDESDGTTAMTVATGITGTSVSDVDISSLAAGFYNIKIEACDGAYCESFLWSGLYGNAGDHLYLGKAGSLKRTKHSGLWTDVLIWEETTGTCNSWVDATSAPDNTHSGWVKISVGDSVSIGAGTSVPVNEFIDGIVNVHDNINANNFILNTDSKIYCSGDLNLQNSVTKESEIILNGDTPQIVKANNLSLNDLSFYGRGEKTFESGDYQVDISGNIHIAPESTVIQNGGTINITGKLILESSPALNATFLPSSGNINVSNDSVKIKQVISQPDKVYSISVPATGNTTPASAGITSGIYYWDNPKGIWTAVGQDELLQRGTGYVCKSLNNLSYSGDVFQSEQFINVTRSAAGLGWNLLGNPFTAAIDWELIDFNQNEIADQFWIWNQSNSVYGVYSSTTGVGVNLDSPTPSVIPSGHSFWIKVNQGYSSSVFPFTKNSRVKNSNSYLKSASLPKYESVRIISHSGLLEDEIALVDVKDASQGVDIYDAEKFLGNDENVLEVFSLISDKKLSINSQPLSEETTIPLGVSCKSSGIYSISLRSNQTDFTVLLKDSLINKIVNLSSSGSYEFEITQSGVKLDRFYVTFLKSVATHVEDSSDSRDIIAYSENGGIWVKKSDNFEKVRFSVYSINGGLAKKGVLIGNNPIFIGQFPTGVYTLAFQSSDNTQLNSVKLLVAKK